MCFSLSRESENRSNNLKVSISKGQFGIVLKRRSMTMCAFEIRMPMCNFGNDFHLIKKYNMLFIKLYLQADYFLDILRKY